MPGNNQFMSYNEIENKLAVYDISSQLLKNFGTEPPIVVCVGSDKVLSDMVGVFVAEKLKKCNANIVVFGGFNRCFNKSDAKYLSNKIDVSRLLFVDSGLLETDGVIAVSPVFRLNNGLTINSTSIIAGTIKKQGKKICLAKTKFAEIEKYAQIIADSICDYLCYVQMLNRSENHYKKMPII